MTARALPSGQPNIGGLRPSSDRDPDYGQPDIGYGEPVWLSKLMEMRRSVHLGINEWGLRLGDPDYVPAPNHFDRNRSFIPATGKDSFGQISGAIALIPVVNRKGKIGHEELGVTDVKVVSAMFTQWDVVRDAFQGQREQWRRANPNAKPEFRDRGLPGTYLLLRERDGEDVVEERLSFNDVINEIPVIVKQVPDETGETLSFHDVVITGFPDELVDQEKHLLNDHAKIGELKSRLIAALRLKEQALANGLDYIELLGLIDPANWSSLSHDERKLAKQYELIRELPERPDMPDSYLWRAYLHNRQCEQTSEKNKAINNDWEMWDYYFKSRIRLRLYDGLAWTDANRYRLVGLLGVVDSVNDMVLGPRHQAALDELYEIHDARAVDNLNPSAKRRITNGSLYYLPARQCFRDPPETTMTCFAYKNDDPRRVRPQIDALPMSAPLDHRPFHAIDELLDEANNGFDMPSGPRIPGLVFTQFIKTEEGQHEQLTVMSADRSLGAFGLYSEAFGVTVGPTSVQDLLLQATNPKISNTYRLIANAPNIPRGWAGGPVLQRGEWTGMLPVDPKGNPSNTEGVMFIKGSMREDDDNYGAPVGSVIEQGSERKKGLLPVLRNRSGRKESSNSNILPGVSRHYVPVLPAEHTALVSAVSEGEGNKVNIDNFAATVMVDPVSSMAVINTGKHTNALIISPVGRGRKTKGSKS